MLLTAASAVIADVKVREYLDEETTATVTYATDPLVFARERPELGVNVREYLSLAPLTVNKAGRRTHFLFGYAWCTGRMSDDQLARYDRSLVLLGDARRIALEARAPMREAGLARTPWPAPAPGARPLLFPVDLELLRFIVMSRVLSAEMPLPGTEPAMTLRRDGRKSFVAHLAHVPN